MGGKEEDVSLHRFAVGEKIIAREQTTRASFFLSAVAADLRVPVRPFEPRWRFERVVVVVNVVDVDRDRRQVDRRRRRDRVALCFGCVSCSSVAPYN